MLDPDVIAVIKQTVPVLSARGEELTAHFYRRMFAGNPEVRAFFNPAHQHAGTQQRALAGAICAYAEHIDRPEALADALGVIAHKHVSLGVRPEHYPIVGEHLLGSIREVLGDAATDEVVDAWAAAYGVLADVLIAQESGIYNRHVERHGWQGFARFRVEQKRPESETITSFHLRPEDGSAVGGFEPGQYISVRVPAGEGGTTMRNYSLSCGPGEGHFRISVKREPSAEPGGPSGHVSNYLHDRVGQGDTLEVAPPCGEFTLRGSDDPDRPLVLISGGVGITPLLSMAHAAAPTGRPTWFIHGAVDGRSHAFGDEVRGLARRHANLRVHVRYSDPTAADRDRGGHDDEGLIDLALIERLTPGPACDFYFCGPKPMMASLHRGLREWGVEPSSMHYEFFGPAEALGG